VRNFFSRVTGVVRAIRAFLAELSGKKGVDARDNPRIIRDHMTVES
jgi:hypothetical protein